MRLVMNSFVICHFSYCPVVWTFLTRTLNVRIIRLHEKAMQVTGRDFDSSCEELLKRELLPYTNEISKDQRLRYLKLRLE